MTAEEKTVIANFLDLAGDYLKDGYKRERETVQLTDDAISEGLSALPLAYQVDEDEDEEPLEQIPSERAFLADSLEAIAADIAACKACALAATRTLVVPGEGVESPLVMVVGEGPGADEDRAGRPFVGRAGQLLDKMLDSIGLSRNKNCFIGNMVKCRPPGNRDPGQEEIAACSSFLERQITLLRPQVILCAGRVAAQNLLKTNTGINALRGEFKELSIGETMIPVLCTFHPSAILRDESLKRPAWEDLKLLKSRLEERD
jgi:DNA polymerase